MTQLLMEAEDVTGFQAAKQALDFILGGNATFTLRSKATGNRFTYRVRAKDKDNGSGKLYFVSLLRGAEYVYFGIIVDGRFRIGRAARVDENDASVKAFAWMFRHLSGDSIHNSLEIWHEGRCGRCGRKLTVPQSLASGFGPECAGRR